MSELDQILHVLTTLNAYRTLLGDAAVDAVLTPMNHYLGEHNLPRAERRIVTVLFADLVGFTSLSAELGPEETRDLINACFDAFIPAIERYGGTIDKFIGDAIMVVFGAPVSHENDPERAIRTALEMLEALQHFNQKHQTDLQIHIGINTGLVVAGGIGSQGRQSYTVIGDTVNVASRLVNHAEAGTILIGADTFRATKPLIQATELEPIELKGKPEPVQAYRLDGLAEQPGSTRGISGIQAPLIGRDREIQGLRQGLSQLEDGRGSVVLLVGEAGIGKSRLIRTLQEDAASAKIGWHHCQGVAYDTQRPYSMFGQLLRTWFGLSDTATAHVIQERLQERLHNRVDLAPVAVAALEMLLSNHITNAQRLSGATFQRQLKRLMQHWWRYEAQQQPLVLIFDDLHWSDSASISLLQALSELVHDVPLMIICATRPDWGELPAFRQALHDVLEQTWELEPLSTSDSDEMVNQLLRIADIPIMLRQDILHKSEGIPFFVEEIVRELIDQGVVVRDEEGLHWHTTKHDATIELPENLQTLLIARIDRLKPTTKSILQQASVIGRRFSEQVLQELSPEASILEHLHELQQAELIIPQSTDEYIFRHALTQEAAYHTILVQERRQLHAQVGTTLVSTNPDRLNELAPQLAFHFRQAGQHQEAFEYLLMAADAAASLYVHDQAIAHYQAAIELDEQMDIATSEQRIQMYSRIGRSHELHDQHHQALDMYVRAIERAEAVDDPKLRISAMLSLATLRAIPSPVQHVRDGEELARHALELARKHHDPAAEARALWALSLALDFANKTEEGMQYGLQSLYLARQHQLIEQQAYTQNDLSRLALALEGPEPAIFHYEESRPLWRDLNNLPMLVDNLNGSALMYYLYGQLDKTYAAASEALEISRRIGNDWGEGNSLNWTGYAQLEEANLTQAFEQFEAVRGLSQHRQMTYMEIISTGDLAWVYSLIGQYERAEALFQSPTMQHKKLVAVRLSWPLIIRARIMLRLGNPEAAEEQLELCSSLFDPNNLSSFSILLYPLAKAELLYTHQAYNEALEIIDELIKGIRKFRVRLYVPTTYGFRAWLLIALKRFEEARADVDMALEEAHSMGTKLILPSLYMLRAYIAEQIQETNVDQYWEQAQALINAQSEQLSPEFRDTFLQLHHVQAILQRSYDPQANIWL